MDRIPVDSTTLASVGYDAGTQLLELEFTSGRVYRYFDVPSETYDLLMAAASKGQFFNASIRDRYRYEALS